MARENKKVGPKNNKDHIPGQQQMPGSIPGIENTIADLLQNLSTGISASMASFYVGDTQVKNATDLENKSKQKTEGRSILGNNKSIYSLLDKIKSAIVDDNDKGATIKTAINSIASDALFISNISANISQLVDALNNINFNPPSPASQPVNAIDPNIQKSINLLKNSIDELVKINKLSLKNKIPDQKVKIELLLSGINDDAIDSLIKLTELSQDKKTNKALRNLLSIIHEFFDFDKAEVEALKENISMFEEMIQKINDLGNAVDKAEAAAQKIKNVNKTIVETAIEVNEHQKEIKESVLIINGLNSFMVAATIVMSIGALFMMMGGGKFVENALMFGITLAIFESLLIAPIMMFKKKSLDAIKSISELSEYVVTCTTIMLVGALFMALSNGKLAKNALKFGVVLMAFEALVVAPFMVFSNESNKLMHSLQDFNSFLITCTTILLVGALFMSLSNGKMVQNALKFGVVLMAFEALVIAPFILYSEYSSGVNTAIKDFASLIIVCTVILSVGALFVQMGNGKFVVNALAFGLLLMAFEALVVAPFLLFDMIDGQINSGLKSFNTVIVSCTIILLVGAMFMHLGGGKFAKSALEFTGLLMLFEAGVIAPFILFNLIKGVALSSLKSFTLFMIASTTCLLVGSLFMSMKNGRMAEYALDYTKLLGLFVLGIIAATKPIKSLLRSSAMTRMEEFSVFLAVCTGCLVVGSVFIKRYGTKAALIYAGVLLEFIKYMGKVSENIAKTFNKKTLDSLKPFSIFLATMHGILTTGILFTKKYGILAGAEYATAFDLFIGGMGLAAQRITEGFDGKTLNSLKPFSLFVAVMHGILMTGTAFMNSTNAWKSAIGYAAVITYFVDMMLVPIAAIQAIKTLSIMQISKGGIAGSLTSATKGSGLMGFMLFVGAMHFIILSGAVFTQQYGWAVPLYATMLGLFTWGMIGIMQTLDNHQKDVQEGAKTLALISGSLFVFAGVVKAIDEMFPFENLAEAKIIGKVIVMTSLMFGLGKLYEILTGKTKISLSKEKVREASIIIGEISISLGVFSGVVWLIDQMKIGFDTVIKVGLMEMIIVGTLHFMNKAATGIDKNKLLLANGILLLTSIVLGVYGSVIFYLNSLFKEVNWLDMINGMLKLTASIAVYGGIFWAIGTLMTNPAIGLLVAAGGATLIAMGEILFIYGSSIAYIDDVMKKHKTTILENIRLLSLTVNNDDPKSGSMLKLFVGIDKIAAIATVTALSIIPIKRAAKGITDVVLMMAEAVKSLKNIDLKSGIDMISSNIETFMDIPNKVAVPSDNEVADTIGNNWIGKTIGKIVGAGKMEMKLLYLMSISQKIAYITGTVGRSIYEIAKLQIPTDWDEKGHVIRYRQLRQTDFDLAGENVGTILTTMINKLNETYTTLQSSGFSFRNSLLLSFIGEDPLSQIMNLSLKVSKVISSVGESVGNIAQMLIPVEWNDQGKPISFRQLRKKDFTDAGTNITTILGTMFTALGKIADGKNIEGIDQAEFKALIDGDSDGLFGLGGTKSKISKVIDLSFRISELIGNIGQGIKDIAALQIPIAWDDKGHPIEYRSLTQTDFDNMGRGVGLVVTGVISKLAELYNSKIGESDVTVGSLFDGKDGVFGIGKKNSKIGTVIDASFKVSELIANIGKGIKDIAKLQVPNDWDDKGHPISYVSVTAEDFRNAGIAVGDIVTNILDALVQYAGDERFTDGTMKTVLESIMPVNELVSGMSDGIVKLANNQIPIRWDPKTGKPIEFREMKESDYLDAAINVGAIAIGIGKALVDTFSKPEYEKFLFTDGQPNGQLKEVVDSVSGISGIVSNTADAIVKIANALIPSHYDPKTGQPDKWEKINISEIQLALSKTIGDIVTSVSKTLIGVVDGNPDLFKDGKDSLFGQAVSSISGITKIVSNIIDSVVKIGTAQIPKKINDQGQVIEYEKIKISDVINNIKTTIPDLVKSLGEGLIFAYDVLSILGINEKLAGIKSVNTSINNIIRQSSTTLKDIAEAKIATGYDNDGNPKGYTIFNEDAITKARSKARLIISSLLTIFDEDTAKKEQKISIDDTQLNNLIKTSGQIQQAITEISGTIKSVINSFKPIIENTDVMNKIFNYKKQTKANIDSTIGLFADIYDIFTSFAQLQNLLSAKSTDNVIKELYDEQVRKQNEENNQIVSASLENIVDTVSDIIDMSTRVIDSYVNKIDLSKIKYINENNKESNIITELINKFYQPIFKLFSDWKNDKSALKDILEDIQKIDQTMTTLFAGINSVYKSHYGNVYKFANTIDSIFNRISKENTTFNRAVENIYSSIQKLASIYSLNIKDMEANNIFDIIVVDVQDYIDNAINPFDMTMFLKATNLKLSVDQLYGSMAGQKNTNTFKANTDLLAKYVKTINTVDVRKANTLTRLVQELNELAKRMGNLDNLTDTLANKLSVALDDLAKRLEESKATIDKADEIQIRRHSKINEAIKNVQDLMQKPLNIVVKSETPDNPNPGEEGDDKGKTDDTSAKPSAVSGGVDNKTQTGSSTPNSAERAKNANGKQINQQNH